MLEFHSCLSCRGVMLLLSKALELPKLEDGKTLYKCFRNYCHCGFSSNDVTERGNQVFPVIVLNSNVSFMFCTKRMCLVLFM